MFAEKYVQEIIEFGRLDIFNKFNLFNTIIIYARHDLSEFCDNWRKRIIIGIREIV